MGIIEKNTYQSFKNIVSHPIQSYLLELCIGELVKTFISPTAAGFQQKDLAPTYLQLPLRQWGAGNVYLVVLSKAKR